MRCFSLFSGIGGFDLALQTQGHVVVGACEIDKYARSVYQKHFPDVPMWKDATRIKPEELPDFEMLCAGFPCQAFSIAGKRLGFEESRGTLFFEIVRIAKQKQPRYLFLENVKGLLSHDNGNTLRTIIKTLNEVGYDAEWQVINSRHFVPQNRERIFIIGHLRGESTKQVFPLGENDRLSESKEEGEQKSQQGVWCEVASTIDARYGALRNSGETYLVIPCLTGGGHSGGLHSDMTMIYEDERARRLTPVECERLQGFPDGWTEGISDTQRYKSIGNAVTVPVIEYIAKELSN